MPAKARPIQTGPLAFQLEVEFLDRLAEPVRDKKAKSVSAIIRTALQRYHFEDVVVLRPAQVLYSVRLPAGLRRRLKKTARIKHTSVGHLVRAAVEAYLPQIEAVVPGQLEMPIVETPVSAVPALPSAKRGRAGRCGRVKPKGKAGTKTNPRRGVRHSMTKKRKG